MRYIAVEGCIGAGKTVSLDLVDDVRRHHRHHHHHSHGKGLDTIIKDVLREPVHEWADMLGDFYTDPPRNSYKLQMEILRSRFQQLRDSERALHLKADDVVLSERCVESSSDVFVPMLRDEHRPLMARHEEDMLRRWECTLKSLTPQHTMLGLIFVDASPEKCLERIRRRDRLGESDIPLEYIQALRSFYVKWLDGLCNKGIPIEVVNSEDEGGFDTLGKRMTSAITRLTTK